MRPSETRITLPFPRRSSTRARSPGFGAETRSVNRVAEPCTTECGATLNVRTSARPKRLSPARLPPSPSGAAAPPPGGFGPVTGS